jgi:integrase
LLPRCPKLIIHHEISDLGNNRGDPMKKKLTVRGINALKPADPGKRYVLWDTEVSNFGLRVTDAGKISFIVMRRVDGKLLRRVVAEHRVGAEYTDGLLSKARADAREALNEMRQGIDPKQKRARAREEELAAQERANRDKVERKANSFGVVAEDFIKRHVMPKLKSGKDVASSIRRELIPAWGDRPISDISRRDVVKLLENVVDDGRPYTAHHLIAYLSKLFNWAIVRDVYGLNASPITRGIGKDIIGAKKPRQRVLSDAELREIWRATEETPYPFGPFVRVLLVTGQRLREVANAQWSEFDLDSALWTIPAERMKGDAAHEVPLSPLAIEILRSLPKDEKKPRDPNAYVFSTMGGKTPISGFSKAKIALDRLLAETRAKATADGETPATLPGWVFHDLRRTMRTNLSGLPVPDLVAELVIAHAKPGLHKVYDQHAYRDEKKRALDLWAAKLLSIVEGTGGGNVVRLTARGS